MARILWEGLQADKILKEEQRAKEERSLRYEVEQRYKEEEEEDEDVDMDQHQYMAEHKWNQDDDVRKSIEYSDMFDLDDPSMKAKFQLLSSLIANSVVELRRLQRSSDGNGGVASPKETVDGWIIVGKERIPPNAKKNTTYANVVQTRSGVTGIKPTSESDPLDARRSPRIQNRVRISGRNGTPPSTRQTQEQRSPRRNTRTPSSSLSPS